MGLAWFFVQATDLGHGAAFEDDATIPAVNFQLSSKAGSAKIKFSSLKWRSQMLADTMSD